MAARRHKKHHHEEHENHERWLVSGYDMMTLLFAVFVVLFAISSTNKSKIVALQQSLQEAFSGPVLSGGQAMQQTGNTRDKERETSPAPPLPTLTPVQAVEMAMRSGDNPAPAGPEAIARVQAEEAGFQALKKRIDRLAKQEGISDKVHTAVVQRGLRIRLMTDKLLFDSGSAVVRRPSLPTVMRIGHVIAEEGRHPVSVEGHTDDRPIATGQFPSNWQLSGARAGAVVQLLTTTGVRPYRLSVAGYASQKPIASNDSHVGRSKNRRVEIILTRLHGANK